MWREGAQWHASSTLEQNTAKAVHVAGAFSSAIRGADITDAAGSD